MGSSCAGKVLLGSGYRCWTGAGRAVASSVNRNGSMSLYWVLKDLPNGKFSHRCGLHQKACLKSPPHLIASAHRADYRLLANSRARMSLVIMTARIGQRLARDVQSND